MKTVLLLFLIAAIGYLLGSITVRGVNLGTSMVLIVALLFGHFGVVMPAVIKDIGLAMFVGAVGLIAGPVFFSNFKKKTFHYLSLGVVIILTGSLATIAMARLLGTPGPLATGIFTGALTSTPALAAAMEVAPNDPQIPVGYGVAYLFGVVGVVLFVQVLPKLMRRDLVAEAEIFSKSLLAQSKKAAPAANLIVLESSGLLIFSAVMLLGLLLGSVNIPLPGGLDVSLGTTGGPLFAGIIAGHFTRIGRVSITVPKVTLTTLRELGLMLFLVGAGTDAGSGFLETVREYGVLLFIEGAVITLAPLIVGTVFALFVLRMDLVSLLGAICGGMTSTPALGSLISAAKTDDVTVAYAATYPLALICVIIASKLLMFVL